jgi:hypothetical protein
MVVNSHNLRWLRRSQTHTSIGGEWGRSRIKIFLAKTRYHCFMTTPQIVLDTNVLVSGLRSRRGSAFQILTLVDTGRFDIHLSVQLVLEYQDVLHRELPNLYITATDVDDLIEFHCSVAKRHQIFFLWRPFLPDPKDRGLNKTQRLKSRLQEQNPPSRVEICS